MGAEGMEEQQIIGEPYGWNRHALAYNLCRLGQESCAVVMNLFGRLAADTSIEFDLVQGRREFHSQAAWEMEALMAGYGDEEEED